MVQRTCYIRDYVRRLSGPGGDQNDTIQYDTDEGEFQLFFPKQKELI